MWIESLDSISARETRQTADNSIYKVGYRYVYRYYYIDSTGKKYLQKLVQKPGLDRDSSWELVPLEAKDALTNDQVSISIEEGPAGTSLSSGVVQTQINYEYFSPAGQLYFMSYTGVVENQKNIWIHPPRSRLFKILELNPFPFVQTPFAVGHEWKWQLEIGAGWGSPRWKEWKGSITNNYHYQITGEKVLDTPVGTLNCLVTESKASSSLGTTYLTSYFHPEWGFVLLDYTNIDGSKIVLELLRREHVTNLTKHFLR